MIQDIISASSIICNFKKVAKNAKIRSSSKLPDMRYKTEMVCQRPFQKTENQSVLKD